MPKRVLLHVGSPKTGTTFVQQVLWSQRALAKEQGLLLPLDSVYDHFLANVDIRETWSELRSPAQAVGVWDRLVRQGLAWDGNVLVSHELFAAATSVQARRAAESWGDAEVHVIVTARDLERQIPAEWQEHLKYRSSLTFSAFVEELRSHGPAAEWFWSVQDYADVCRRWSAAVPVGNVHLVTVPAQGSAPDVLWGRFASLLEVDASRFDLPAARANPSLRAEQAELLRRINSQLGERLPVPGPYPGVVKDAFVLGVLAGRPGLAVTLAGDDRAFALARSTTMVDELRQQGVDVVGDLAELIPPEHPPDRPEGFTDHPEALPDSTLLDESIEALSGLLERFSKERERAAEGERAAGESAGAHSRAQDELARSRAELGELRDRHDWLVNDLRTRPVRQLVIGVSEGHPRLMRLRVGYWRLANLVRRVSSWRSRLGKR